MLNQRVVRSIAVMTVKLPGARFGLATLLGLLILFPHGAEASGPLAYITNSNDNTVSVIATASNTVTATVPVGVNPLGLAVTPDGAHVYVGNFSDNTVSVIATASNTVTATVPVGVNPVGLAVTPDGTHVYVSNQSDNTVSVIATTANAVSATVPVGVAPQGLAAASGGAHVYVANFSDNTVSVIATASNTVTATEPVGASPVAFGQFIGIVRVTVPFASLISSVEIEQRTCSRNMPTTRSRSRGAACSVRRAMASRPASTTSR